MLPLYIHYLCYVFCACDYEVCKGSVLEYSPRFISQQKDRDGNWISRRIHKRYGESLLLTNFPSYYLFFFVGHRKGQLHTRFRFLILRQFGDTGEVVIAKNLILICILSWNVGRLLDNLAHVWVSWRVPVNTKNWHFWLAERLSFPHHQGRFSPGPS